MEVAAGQLVPGTKVVVTQQIPMRNRVWTNTIRGTVVSFAQQPTGSGFAHSKGDRLWLDRLVLRKDDGEITTLNLDEFTRVEVEPDGNPPPAAASEPPAT